MDLKEELDIRERLDQGGMSPADELRLRERLESASEQALERTQLPQDQRSEGTPPWRTQLVQGSVSDMQVPQPQPPEKQGFSTDVPPFQPWRAMPEGAVREPIKSVSRVGARVLEQYEERVASPYRKSMFLRDPLEIMQERVINSQPGWDRVKAELGLFATGLLMDPLNATTAGLAVRGAIQSLAHKPPVQPAVPVTAPVQAAPIPELRDLAQAHQDALLGPQRPASAGQASSSQPGLEPGGTSGQIGQTPMPGERVQAGDLPTRPEPAFPPSRRLHGRDLSFPEQGPPKPPFRSAEEMLQDQLQGYIQRRTETLQQLPPVPEKVPEFLGLMVQREQAGPRGAIDQGGAKGPLDVQQRPLDARRLYQQAYDVLDDLGPNSEALSNILRYSWDYSEAGTRQNFLDYIALVKHQFGDRPVSNRAKALMSGNLSEMLNRGVRDFGLTAKEQDALVELHEIGRSIPSTRLPNGEMKTDFSRVLDLVTPAAKERLKAELLDPRLQRLAEQGWQIMTGRASSLPEVQQRAMIHDPITGKSTPVGQPSMYWPHQPVTIGAKIKLSHATMKRIYEERGYAGDMPFQEFERRMTNWLKSDKEEVELRRYHGIESPRWLNMLEDAKSHNRTVAESLRFYGYETDPLRALLRHNLYSLKRSVFLKYSDQIDTLMNGLREQYAENPYAYDWINTVLERSQGISAREDMVLKTNRAWSAIQSLVYPAFLKASWAQNLMMQPNYSHMFTGAIRPIADRVWRTFGKQLGMSQDEIKAAVDRSAANFPAFMSKYHAPEGAWEQYNKTFNTLNWFAPSDDITRVRAGMLFIPHAEHLIRQWWKDPSNKAKQASLKEGNLNPSELYQEMAKAPAATHDASGVPPIPPRYLERYAQVMTNKTMGRMDLRSLPLWMARESDTHRLFMMLHRQIASNETLAFRSISNAPTVGEGIKRFLRLTLGAEVAGSVYQGFTNFLVGNNILDVNESLKKQFPGHEGQLFAIKSLLLGYGTFTSGLILAGLNMYSGNFAGAGYALVSPPAANFIDELVTKLMKGRLGAAAIQVSPLQFPKALYDREQAQERKQHRGTGLREGLGIGLAQ